MIQRVMDEISVMQAMSDLNFTIPIRIVNFHVEGEVGDVTISGAGDTSGATIRDQSRSPRRTKDLI